MFFQKTVANDRVVAKRCEFVQEINHSRSLLRPFIRHFRYDENRYTNYNYNQNDDDYYIQKSSPSSPPKSTSAKISSSKGSGKKGKKNDSGKKGKDSKKGSSKKGKEDASKKGKDKSKGGGSVSSSVRSSSYTPTGSSSSYSSYSGGDSKWNIKNGIYRHRKIFSETFCCLHFFIVSFATVRRTQKKRWSHHQKNQEVKTRKS